MKRKISTQRLIKLIIWLVGICIIYGSGIFLSLNGITSSKTHLPCIGYLLVDGLVNSMAILSGLTLLALIGLLIYVIYNWICPKTKS